MSLETLGDFYASQISKYILLDFPHHADTWNETHVVIVHGMAIPGRPQKDEQSIRIARPLHKSLVSQMFFMSYSYQLSAV